MAKAKRGTHTHTLESEMTWPLLGRLQNGQLLI